VISRDQHQISVSNRATTEDHHIPSSGLEQEASALLSAKELVSEMKYMFQAIRLAPQSSLISYKFLQRR